MARLERIRRKNLLHRQIDRRSKRHKNLQRWVSQLEQLEQRCMLATGPVLAGITTNNGNVLSASEVLNESPKELQFRFDGNQQIDVATLGAITVTRTNFDGQFGNGNDIAISPGYVGLGDNPNDVVFRFAETLPDDVYRIRIDGASGSPLKNTNGDIFNDGISFALEFELDLGAYVQAIVPQPISRDPTTGRLVQSRNTIEVYFNNDDLDPTLAENPNFYQLIFTGHANSFDPGQQTATNLDDGTPVKPSRVTYSSSNDMALLTFAAADLADLSVGTYRLRVGTNEGAPAPPAVAVIASDPGSSFATATLVPGNLNDVGQVLQAGIEAQLFPLQLPGSNTDPGHRLVSTELDKHVADGARDTIDGTSTIAYNFEQNYGEDPQGNPFTNAITEQQKQRAREVFELYAHYLGVQFIETTDEGFTIATGDLRAIDPRATNDPAILAGLSGVLDDFGPTAVISANANWDNGFGESWFQEAMRQIGFLLGMGASLDLPGGTVMGSDPRLEFGLPAEPIFPGDHDIVHGQLLYRPDSIDIDMYKFKLNNAGLFTAEIHAERFSTPSHLDSVLRLYQETDLGTVLISQNDDYFSQDSLIEMDLAAGTYYIGVSSKGNDDYDPNVEGTGYGGTTQGAYSLRLNHRPNVNDIIRDTTGVAFDGDADGAPGGVFNFWFRIQTGSNTHIVDKSAAPGGTGSLLSPFRSIPAAMNAADAGDIVRVVGNHLGDNVRTNDLAYEIGIDPFGNPLADGSSDGLLRVKSGVTMMVDAGAIVKLRRGAIVVGSTSANVPGDGAALQVLGTPKQSVFFTSFNDDAVGVDNNPLPTVPGRGDWGGIVFRSDQDTTDTSFTYDDQGIFLDYINGADIRYGGGVVSFDSVPRVINPVTMVAARPTITNNSISNSADAAMSASANSFAETNYQGPEFQSSGRFTPDYSRIGPTIHGNRLVNNTSNGMAIVNQLGNGSAESVMTVSGRWNDSDVVHIVSESLTIEGSPGGQVLNSITGQAEARLDARLTIDAGTIVKLEGAFIRVDMGATLLAEGTATHPVVFTSLLDDRYGFGGTFDTNGDGVDGGSTAPTPGDWAGIYIGHTGLGSIDNAVIAYGGGVSTLGGSFSGFNAIAIHQADARITNSRLEFNADGTGGVGPAERFGLGKNNPGTIFVRGAQPIIVGNDFLGNEAPVISINVNSLNHQLISDGGRQTGNVDVFPRYFDNHGPLIRENTVTDNMINGLEVRGGTTTTESVWDDVDIVHVLQSGIYIPNFHSFGGVRLQSAPTQSLVIKLLGDDAGFTTTGTPLAITDYIGGRLQVIGQPGYPVVMTSLFDDLVGAGLDNRGNFQTDTNNGGRPTRSVPLSDPNTFKIDVNFGPNISLNQDFVDGVLRAVNLWEMELQDPVRVVIDVEIADLGAGRTGWIGDANRIGANLMQTDPAISTFAYGQVRDAMIADGGSHEEILAGLPNTTDFANSARLPVDRANPYKVSPTMRLTRANAKALGLVDGATGGSDGSITIHSDPSVWDFNRKDGLLSYREEFETYMMREIGEILGFISGVDEVNNALLVPTTDHDVNISPIDMFRFEPGVGGDDFTNGSRVLDPRVPNHVFNAGGDYDSSIWPIPGIEKGDIPLSTGLGRQGEYNDVFGAAHWRDDVVTFDEKLIVNKPIGVMDPVSRHRDQVIWRNDSFQSTEGLQINMSEQDRLAFDVIGWDVVGGSPGDWHGIDLESLTHDRNASTVLEQEAANGPAPGANGSPDTAQYIGSLAEAVKLSEENRKLGFEVHGLLNANKDVDVYSFDATSGTRVVIDIDRTSTSLNSVVELISANGVVLARSDDSYSESESAAALLGGAQPLGTSDLYSTNVRDAGMIVTIPGPIGLVSTQYVRVRSSSDNLSNVAGGKTQGAYQLQIRLEDMDEIPGTSIQFADIRYADIGINIVGPPIRSPLTGDHVEDESFNDTWIEFDTPVFDDNGEPTDEILLQTELPYEVGAQKLGNLLTSDLGAISVFGNLSNSGDVDWYSFRLGYDRLLDLDGEPDPNTVVVDPEVLTAGVVLDIDYADGLSRANTVLSVYNSIGQLIYFSSGGAIAADQHGAGAGVDDLSRGSFGTKDAFIGPIELTASRVPREENFVGRFGGFFGGGVFVGQGFAQADTYYVAVSSIAQVPQAIGYGNASLTPVLGNPERGSAVTVLPPVPPVFDPTDPRLDPDSPFFDPFFLDSLFGPCYDDDGFFGGGGGGGFFGVGRDTNFCTNPNTPGNAALSGEYQLEIRYVPVPEGGLTASDATKGDQNRERDQGQITISGNRIDNSLQFGIVVEDAPRDFPNYFGDFLEDGVFDVDVSIQDQLHPLSKPHSNFTTSDYGTKAAAARGLTAINEERLVPGISINNNVISGGVEGGLHLQGDPNGILIQTYNLAELIDLQPDFDEGDINGTQFTLWDHQRNSQTFEFDNDGTLTDPTHLPIKFNGAIDDDGCFYAGTWEQCTSPTIGYLVAYEIEHAIRLSNLDVKVSRTENNAIFVEGAVEIGHPSVQNDFDSVFLPPDAFLPIITAVIVQQGPVPFVRVVNNTIVGRGGDLFDGKGTGDVGVLIEDNASPTLLNNVIANFDTAMKADRSSTDQNVNKRTFVDGASIPQVAFYPDYASRFFGGGGGGFILGLNGQGLAGFNTFTGGFFNSLTTRDIDSSLTDYVAPRPTVIGGTVFQGNNQRNTNLSTGNFPITLLTTDPLFVDPERGNFFLASASRAIDSSVNSIQERSGLASLLSAVGFEPSAIIAPDTDADGLLRVDDPSVEPPSGIGQNAFKDRGALERADFDGITATLIKPADNDPDALDLNPQSTEVFLLGGRPNEFLIQLVDAGTGADDGSVASDRVTVTSEGVLLTAGVDYTFSYDVTSNLIRLAPLVGAWPDNASYIVTIDNSTATGIRDKSNNLLLANQPDGKTRFSIQLGRGFDFGDAPSPYPVTLAENGARHTFSPNVYLGSAVDVDADGQPSTNADRDVFDDGIRFDSLFIPGAPFQFTATVSVDGLLNVWIDLNADGDWNDPNERLIANRNVTAGPNSIRLENTPTSSALDNTDALGVAVRFRFSTQPVESSMGEAPDGEVEDYFVSINGSPWQNKTNRLDVNGDGSVSPFDALMVINELNDKRIGHARTGQLPIPPIPPNVPELIPDSAPASAQFVDVNGDGFVSPVDALLVIDALPSSTTPPTSAALPAAAALSSRVVVSASNDDAPVNTPAGLTLGSRQAGLLDGLADQRSTDNGLTVHVATKPTDVSGSQPADDPPQRLRLQPERIHEFRRNRLQSNITRMMRHSADAWNAPELDDVLTEIAEDVMEAWNR